MSKTMEGLIEENRRRPRRLRDSLSWKEVRRSPYGIGPVAMFATLGLFGSFGGRIATVAGPNIAQDIGLDLRTIGGIFSVVGTLSIVGTLILGWLSDRRKRTTLAGAGLVIGGTASIIQSQAGDVRTFASAQVGGILGGGLAGVPTFSLLADYYPVETRGRVFSLLTTVGRTFSVLSLLVVGVLVTNIGWRPTTLIAAVPLVVLGLIVLFFMKEPIRGYFEKRSLGLDEDSARREDPPQSFGEGWRTVWSIRMVRRIFISEIFSSIGSTPFAIFLPFFLADVYGFDAKARTLFAIPTVIAGLSGGLLSGMMIDALGKRSPSSVLRLLGASSALPALSLVVLAFHPPVAILVIASALVTFGTTVIAPAFLSIYSQVIPAQVRGQGVQITNLAEIPGTLLLGLIFGSVVTLYGFDAMLALCVPFIIIGALIMVSAADFFEIRQTQRDRRDGCCARSARSRRVR